MRLTQNMPRLMLTSCFVAGLIVVQTVWAGETRRVSISSSGAEANGFFSTHPSISANGRFVAFASLANNLVAGDTNSNPDIFVHDNLKGKTEIVSISSNGIIGNNGAGWPSISADGRFVTFTSSSDNLVTGDTNTKDDVFIHDRLTHLTEIVSADENGAAGNGLSFASKISADGRYVVYMSDAKLVAFDTNGKRDIYLYDRLSKKNIVISKNFQGIIGNGFSYLPNISVDGRFIVFTSDASNLVSNDTNNGLDVFVHDLKTHTTESVNLNANGEQTGGIQVGDGVTPAISANGRFVAFASQANNLVTGDANNVSDIFVHDRSNHQTSLVSVDSNGNQGNLESYSPSISADGQYVAFFSNATNLVDGDTNQDSDIFVHDRIKKVTERVSIDSNGNQAEAAHDFIATETAINADGRILAFEKNADNLVVNDTNQIADIFVRDRLRFPLKPTDLEIKAIARPGPIVRFAESSFVYTITNQGNNATSASLTHLIANGVVTAFTPSQGKCNSYATISLCKFGELQPGASMTLQVNVKAKLNILRQQLSLSSTGGRGDPNMWNNYLDITTGVTN